MSSAMDTRGYIVAELDEYEVLVVKTTLEKVEAVEAVTLHKTFNNRIVISYIPEKIDSDKIIQHLNATGYDYSVIGL